MRYAILGAALLAGCGKKAEPTEAPAGPATERVAAKGDAPGRATERAKEPARDQAAPKAAPQQVAKGGPAKSRYDVPTAGDVTFTQPADLWGLPDQNRAALKQRFFGKRWNLEPSGNIRVETDRILCETHPHTEWLTVTVKFRDEKDLLTFDRYRDKLNGYCVDAFTFVDCVYVK